MSEVDKSVNHMATGRPEAGAYYAGLYNEAQHALAALREDLELSERNRLAAERCYEEMVTARDCIATNYNQLSYGAIICKEKLAAAERRNATMAVLLREVSDSLWQEDDSGDLFERIDAALAQPTESGASE